MTEEDIKVIERNDSIWAAAQELGVYPSTVYKRLQKAGLKVIKTNSLKVVKDEATQTNHGGSEK